MEAMKFTPAQIFNEKERLAELHSLDILDTLPSLRNLFDVITPIVNKLSSPIELEETSIRPDIDVGITRSPLYGPDLQVVAEGVEHEAQRVLLQEFGCDVVQGYQFSRPLLANDALAFLRNWPLAS